MEKYDVCVIGGGVLGTLIAMELSRRPVRVILAEKNEDFCLGISKANSAVLYPGYDHKPGTLKSRLAIEGNRKTAELCKMLGVPVVRCGSLMAAQGPAGQRVLQRKLGQGEESGIPDLRILGREEALELEPSLSPAVTAALFAPQAAVLYPWRLGMEAGRQAEKAGAEVRFGTGICRIERGGRPGADGDAGSEGYILTTEKGEEFFASCVVNAAGLFAGRVRELLFRPAVRIRPSAAEYLVFGKEENPGLRHVIFYEPEDGGKGITLVPNRNGTILAGATDRDLKSMAEAADRDLKSMAEAADRLRKAEPGAGAAFAEPVHATDPQGLRFLLQRTREICPVLGGTVPIRSFAGVRPNPYEVKEDPAGVFVDSGRSIHSFEIRKETPDGSFVSLLGIKTPGITASVPIAEYVAEIILNACREKTPAATFMPDTGEQGAEAVSELSFPEKEKLAEQDPAYGKVVCRCEQVTEGEIRGAVLAGARTAEGVKLRCGAGMGKCQGARCRSAVEELLGEAKPMPGKASVPMKRGADLIPEEQVLTCDCLLVGAGAAGLSLAAELSKADPAARIVLADRTDEPGGVLVQCLHEGFPDPVTGRMLDGPGYLAFLQKEIQEGVQAGRIRFLFRTHVTKIREQEDQSLPVAAEAAADGRWIRILARCGILTCGAIERTAGMLLLSGTRPQGVYTAGEVQRMLNLENRLPGKKGVLVGTGNMGLIMADLMLRKGMEVVQILEKEDHVTASAANIRKYLTGEGAVIPPKIIRFRSVIREICGMPHLTGVAVESVSGTGQGASGTGQGTSGTGQGASGTGQGASSTGQGASAFDCDTLVLAAGLVPDRLLLAEAALSGGRQRILTFGNCEHIYSSVASIRFAARQMAEAVLRLCQDKPRDI